MKRMKGKLENILVNIHYEKMVQKVKLYRMQLSKIEYKVIPIEI